MAKEKKENCDCEDGECDCGHEHPHEHTHSVNPQNFDQETQAAIQEIQILEQNFQQLLQQKQLFNMELNETELAITEVEKSEDELFRIVGNQVIIKTSKQKLLEDLNHKKGLLEARMKNIDKQEKEFSERMETLREEIMKKISPQ